MTPKPVATEKLQKVLARTGLGSRRSMEKWISAGRVEVNGKPARLGVRVSSHDKIRVDGKPVAQARLQNEDCKVLMYHKPEGEVCTRKDEKGRKTIFNSLPRLKQGRWITVGRLDINSAGLLLLTNDGELANRLMHPSHQVEREYAVRVLGEVTDRKLKQLTQGVELEDGKARFNSVHDSGGLGANHWYHVVLTEGRNREVRRMWEAIDIQVSRLIRVRYDFIELPRKLRLGQSEELSVRDVRRLRASVGLKDHA